MYIDRFRAEDGEIQALRHGLPVAYMTADYDALCCDCLNLNTGWQEDIEDYIIIDEHSNTDHTHLRCCNCGSKFL